LFLSSCYRPLRVLHSFPTRRSSDLHGRWFRGRPPSRATSSSALASSARSSILPSGPNRSAPMAARLLKSCGTSDNVHSQCSFARSEEHTSELQSRENLVCRLLLEKK